MTFSIQVAVSHRGLLKFGILGIFLFFSFFFFGGGGGGRWYEGGGWWWVGVASVFPRFIEKQIQPSRLFSLTHGQNASV